MSSSFESLGVFTRDEAVGRLGRYRVRAALDSGLLVAQWPGVLVERERRAEPKTLAAAAILSVGNGAVVADETALYLHGCDAARPSPIHLKVPYDRWPRGRPGVIVHHGRTNPQDVVRVAGMPLQSLSLALADTLCGRRRRSAFACADQALARFDGTAREAFRSAVAAQLELRTDRRGTVQANHLLGLATGLAESPAESSMLLVVVDAGFPTPTPQLPIVSLSGREIYRLDLAWKHLRIGAEYDGYEAHEERQELDAAREADLRRRGWIIVRATAADLADPSRLIAQLHGAFGRRLGSLRDLAA